MISPPPDPIARPRQERSRRTMEALLDAAEASLEERDYASVTVQEIAERAGVTTGALYARFDGKAGLLRGLEERLHAHFGAGLEAELDEERWAREPLPELFRGLIGRMLRGYRARAPLVRAIVLAQRRDEATARRVDAFNREHFREPLTRALSRRSDIAHAEPEEGIEFALFLLANALVTYALFPETDPIALDLSDETFVALLADAVAGFLRGDTAGGDSLDPDGRPGP